MAISSPPVISQLVGHGWVLELLEREIAGRSLPHAHLIVGPPQVGKFTTALAMAQLLLCERGTRCGACRHCTLAGRGAHPDLRVLAIPPDRKNIPVAEVHDFLHGIALRPLEAERKALVIRGADDLAEEGANALLKTLEEPPPTVTIILTAPQSDAVLPTILSRCQVIRLRPVAAPLIAAHLVEHAGVPAERADAIARASKGRPGWAIEAAADPELVGARERQARDVIEVLRAGRLPRLALADALAERWSGHADEVRGALNAWMELWRDVLLTQHGAAQHIAHVDLGPEIAQVARSLPAERVAQALSDTLAIAEALDHNAHPRLALEVYTLRLPHVPA
jgi:DNA polymerase-3 subunit delta'